MCVVGGGGGGAEYACSDFSKFFVCFLNKREKKKC